MHNNDRTGVRLKVHLVLEAETGDRIIEIREDELIPAMFGNYGLDDSYQTLLSYVDAKVTSPIRAMTRAYINKLQERRIHTHPNGLNHELQSDWPTDEDTAERLDTTLAAVFARSRAGSPE